MAPELHRLCLCAGSTDFGFLGKEQRIIMACLAPWGQSLQMNVVATGTGSFSQRAPTVSPCDETRKLSVMELEQEQQPFHDPDPRKAGSNLTRRVLEEVSIDGRLWLPLPGHKKCSM